MSSHKRQIRAARKAKAQRPNTAQFRVVPKSDYLTGERVWSVQERMGNQFCGHWLESSWTTDRNEARKRLGKLPRVREGVPS